MIPPQIEPGSLHNDQQKCPKINVAMQCVDLRNGFIHKEITFNYHIKSDLIHRLQKWPENECINVRIWAMSAETRGLPTGRVKWDGVVHAAHTKDYRPEINKKTTKDQQPNQIETKDWQPSKQWSTNKHVQINCQSRTTASQSKLRYWKIDKWKSKISLFFLFYKTLNNSINNR